MQTNDASGSVEKPIERIDLWRVPQYPMWQDFRKHLDNQGILTLVSDKPIERGEQYRLGFYELDVAEIIEKRKPRGVHAKPAVFYALLVDVHDTRVVKQPEPEEKSYRGIGLVG